jgi:hypothetical protein
VTDWTIVLTTLGSAGIAASAGWYAARKTAEVSLRQADAENERLREQHREDHLRNRQGTYHEFLSADRNMGRTLGEDIRPEQVEEIEALYARWSHLSVGLQLFGSEDVTRAGRALVDEYASVGRALEGNDPDAAEDAAAAYRAAQARINDARDVLLIAMRNDVGPRE